MRIWSVLVGVVVVHAGCSGQTRDFSNEAQAGSDSAGGSAGSSNTSGAAAQGGTSAPPAGGAAGEDGAGAVAGADGEPLAILAFSPAAGSATVRDVIRITFSRPVAEASVASAITVEDKRGEVAGTFEVSGQVVEFRPRRGLCFAESYDVSVATSLLAADGEPLEGEASYDFTIPDGSWSAAEKVSEANVMRDLSAALDDEGNVLLAWMAKDVPAVTYLGAGDSAWDDVLELDFPGDQQSVAAPVVRLRAGRGLMLFPGDGLAERTTDGEWSMTPLADLTGAALHFNHPTVGISGSGQALLAWDNQVGKDDAYIFVASSEGAGEPWLAPTEPLVGAWVVRPTLHPAPDGSFVLEYEKRESAQAPGTLTARRYPQDAGLTDEQQLIAVGAGVSAHDSFGNVVVAARFDGASSKFDAQTGEWTPLPALPAGIGPDGVALAGDGTVFVAYREADLANNVYRLLVRKLADSTWSEATEIVKGSVSQDFLGISADDCGNAHILWSELTSSRSVYARRYTPAASWKPPILIASPKLLVLEHSSNSRGEAVYGFGRGGLTVEESEPHLVRFD